MEEGIGSGSIGLFCQEVAEQSIWYGDEQPKPEGFARQCGKTSTPNTKWDGYKAVTWLLHPQYARGRVQHTHTHTQTVYLLDVFTPTKSWPSALGPISIWVAACNCFTCTSPVACIADGKYTMNNTESTHTHTGYSERSWHRRQLERTRVLVRQRRGTSWLGRQ